MVELKDHYNRRYSSEYRKKISGYEFARWMALDHFVLKVLKLKNLRTLLDYGCGSGLHVNLWKKIFPQTDLYFCDISLVALEKLKQRYPKFELNCREIKDDKAPFEDKFFEVIVSIEVMEHVKNLDKYLNDIYRLLKKKGVFIWTTPCANPFSIEHLYNVFTNQIESSIDGFSRWKWEDSSHIRRLKSKEIKTVLNKIGFKNIGFKFRSHFFSFVCTKLLKDLLGKLGERLMLLDYSLFRRFPNGASMIGYAFKEV